MNIVNLKPGFYSVGRGRETTHLYVHPFTTSHGGIPTSFDFTSNNNHPEYYDCGGYLWNGMNMGRLHANTAVPLLPFQMIELKFKLTMFLRQRPGESHKRRFC